MSTPKTQENNANVVDYIKHNVDPKKQEDALTLLALMESITGAKARMWGSSIIGFGRYHYTNTTSSGSWPITGFSPRKSAHSIYIMAGFSQYQTLLDKLGKHKVGKSCLYINKLADIDLAILTELIKSSMTYMQHKYDCEY